MELVFIPIPNDDIILVVPTGSLQASTGNRSVSYVVRKGGRVKGGKGGGGGGSVVCNLQPNPKHCTYKPKQLLLLVMFNHSFKQRQTQTQQTLSPADNTIWVKCSTGGPSSFHSDFHCILFFHIPITFLSTGPIRTGNWKFERPNVNFDLHPLLLKLFSLSPPPKWCWTTPSAWPSGGWSRPTGRRGRRRRWWRRCRCGPSPAAPSGTWSAWWPRPTATLTPRAQAGSRSASSW